VHARRAERCVSGRGDPEQSGAPADLPGLDEGEADGEPVPTTLDPQLLGLPMGDRVVEPAGAGAFEFDAAVDATAHGPGPVLAPELAPGPAASVIPAPVAGVTEFTDPASSLPPSRRLPAPEREAGPAPVPTT